MAVTPDWGDIHIDLAGKIAEYLEFYEELETFGQTCSLWRHARKTATKIPPSQHTPWLMLADPPCSSKRQLFNLHSKEIHCVDLPAEDQFHADDLAMVNDKVIASLSQEDRNDKYNNWRYFTTKGWLVRISQLGLNVTLVNPWSGQVIRPPPLPREGEAQWPWPHWEDDFYLTLFCKFALSKNPSSNTDFTLAMIYPLCQAVYTWRKGDDHWNTYGRVYEGIVDILYYKGDLYGFDHRGKVLCFGRDNNSAVQKVAKLKGYEIPLEFVGQGFLAQAGGKLLILRRTIYPRKPKEGNYATDFFELWKVNVKTGKLTRVKDIGNKALFVGHNSSFTIDVAPARGCKPNCIYATDTLMETYLGCPFGGGLDMGVFDVASGKKIEECYDGPWRFCKVNPPLWLEPKPKQSSLKKKKKPKQSQ